MEMKNALTIHVFCVLIKNVKRCKVQQAKKAFEAAQPNRN